MIPVGLLASWKGASTATKAIVILVLVAVIVGGLWRIHNVIDKGGYDRAMNEVAEAIKKRDEESRASIIKTEKKYAKIRQNMRGQGGRDLPVSPLVDLAIDSLPNGTGSAPR